MGGRISIGIIEQDGSLKTIETHTKFMPGAIKNEAFATRGDISELRDFLDEYETDMFGEGFGKIKNIPCDYGYVLVDMREKTFLASQRFTNFNIVLGAEIANAEFLKRGGKNGADGLARLITHTRDWDAKTGNMISTPVGPFKDASELLAKPELLFYEKFGPSRSFEIEYKAWKTSFHDYNEDGLAKVRDYLTERNLVSKSELTAWEYAIEEIRKVREENEMLESLVEPEPTPAPQM
jgi:hypothetical protein